MASSPGLLLLLLGYCLALIEGESRCYCNEAGCVVTGYMCKSRLGQCYTLLDRQGQAATATHGCADSLTPDLRLRCAVANEESASGSLEGSGGVALYLCCTEDMCNYLDSVDVSAVSQSKSNGSLQKGQAQAAAPGSNTNHVIYSRHPEERNPDGDLWFKAAVIAVPIAGGFILVLLVLMAVRMLRADSRRDRRLLHVRRERGLAKTHLYVADHFTLADPCGKDCALFSSSHLQHEQHKHKHKHKHCSQNAGGCGTDTECEADREKEVKVDKQGRVYEKVCERGPLSCRQPLVQPSSSPQASTPTPQPSSTAPQCSSSTPHPSSSSHQLAAPSPHSSAAFVLWGRAADSQDVATMV